MPVVRVNQVWSTDITYIRLASGFAYLVAIIDWYSRRVLSWRISNTMEAAFCVDCLLGGGAMIVDKYGAKPEIVGLPIALCSTATAFGQVRIENKSAMQNAKTGAAPFSCVKSGAT